MLRNGRMPEAQSQVFRKLGDWPFAETAGEVMISMHGSTENSLDMLTADAVISIGKAFHAAAGTLTPKVREGLKQVQAHKKWIRVAHQPNFAAYLKVISLFVAAEEVAFLSGAVPVYVMNDFDVASNKRFCRSVLPNIFHPRGISYLSIRNTTPSSSQVMFCAPHPTAQWLQATTELIRSNSKRERALLKNTDSQGQIDVEELISDLEFSWHNSVSLSEMTGILLSRVVNLRLKLGTIFLPGHALWAQAGPTISTFILDRWAEIARSQKAVAADLENADLDLGLSWLTKKNLAPLWWVCICGRRTQLDFAAMSWPLSGTCEPCQETIVIHASDLEDQTALGRLIPRVGCLDLTENLAREMRAGITYVSSAPHTLAVALVAERLGMEVLPHIFINSHGYFGTPAEMVGESPALRRSAVGLGNARALIADGRASSVYYLTRSSAPELLSTIQSYIRKGGLDDPLRVP